MAAQATRIAPGLDYGVTFAYLNNFVTKRKIQYTTTSAKTRAIATRRQQHIIRHSPGFVALEFVCSMAPVPPNSYKALNTPGISL
jgi:hypothetical protein